MDNYLKAMSCPQVSSDLMSKNQDYYLLLSLVDTIGELRSLLLSPTFVLSVSVCYLLSRFFMPCFLTVMLLTSCQDYM